MNDKVEEFKSDVINRIQRQSININLKNAAQSFLKESILSKYSYNFSWLGVPIIQYPQDIIAMQEIIWQVKPDLIIETGIAHGGSIIFYASILKLIGRGDVLGIDIDIRDHNRKVIEAHPVSNRIHMIEGSSIDPDVVSGVKKMCEGMERIMVILDSNHTHEHVLKELEIYSKFVTVHSYLVVFDTIIEELANLDIKFLDRAWGKDNNPKTAINKFLLGNNNFIIDNNIDEKFIITVAPGGYLKRVK